MENTKKTEALRELAQIATPSAGHNSTAQDRMAELLVLKMEKEIQAEKEEADRSNNMRLAQLENIRQQMRNTELTQAQCPHMKPNFRPAIGGQRDSKNHTHWLCQYCQKAWMDNELPIHLRIPSEMVGGPQ